MFLTPTSRLWLSAAAISCKICQYFTVYVPTDYTAIDYTTIYNHCKGRSCCLRVCLIVSIQNEDGRGTEYNIDEAWTRKQSHWGYNERERGSWRGLRPSCRGLRASWRGLRASWRGLWASWRGLGASWKSRRPSWNESEAQLGGLRASWRGLGASWRGRSPSWRDLRASWKGLKPSRGV